MSISLQRMSLVACAALAGSGLLVACGPNNPLPGAIAQAEQFDFNFVRLQTNANGQIVVRMKLDSVCRDYLFTPSELADALRTKQFVRNAITFTFRFEALEPCQTVGEVKFETAQLSQPFTDPSGAPKRQRPHNTVGFADVVTELSSGGVMEVAVFGNKINGTTTSRTNAAGPVDLSSAEAAAGPINSGGGFYAAANVNPVYAKAELTGVLTNPNRFTGSFEFLAKTDPTSNEVLLVFDGDMVLRLDVED